jgi:hypothetical protein
MPSRKRSRSPCKANQIRNPATGRCVKRNGSIGKKIRSRSRSPARRSPVSRSRCRSGYRKNRSGRCVKRRAGSRKRCSPGYKRSASGRCVRKRKSRKSRSRSPINPFLPKSECPPGFMADKTGCCHDIVGRPNIEALIKRGEIPELSDEISSPEFKMYGRKCPPGFKLAKNGVCHDLSRMQMGIGWLIQRKLVPSYRRRSR